MSILIGIVEDNEAYRRRLMERLLFYDDIEIAFAVGDAEASLSTLASLPFEEHPSVILMDIELPGMSGIKTTLHIKDRYAHIDLLMLTVYENDEKIFASIQAGASGYLLKDVTTEELVDSLRELERGGAPMSPVVARKLMAFVRSRAESPTKKKASSFNLSKRELQLLEGLVLDETEYMIADRLCISHHTVRTHFKNIYKKLHVHSRAGAVRVTLENKLLP